jgi:hypothetical protein
VGERGRLISRENQEKGRIGVPPQEGRPPPQYRGTMEVGTEVWVRSAAEVWAPGEVVDCQHARSSGVVRVRLLGSGEVVSRT